MVIFGENDELTQVGVELHITTRDPVGGSVEIKRGFKLVGSGPAPLLQTVCLSKFAKV